MPTEHIMGPMRGVLKQAEIAWISEQLSGSCTTEIAAFTESAALLTDTHGNIATFDDALFDTGQVDAAQMPSPVCLNNQPPCASIASRSTSSCAVNAVRIASASASHRRVEPSTSANRNIYLPVLVRAWHRV